MLQRTSQRRCRRAKAHGAVPTNFSNITIEERGHAALCPPYDIEFVARSSSSRHGIAASRRNSPELCLVSLPSKSKRAQGRPGAQLAPAVCCAIGTRRRTAQQHTGVANHSAFPAQWLDGLCRDLPGADHSFWPPSPRELMMQSARLGSLAPSQDLTVATTARTTRFCRTHGPPFRRSFPEPCRQSRKLTDETKPDSAARRTKPRAHRDTPPCPRLSCRRCRVHRKPGSRCVTTHDRPSW
ncbi:hypothetical protein ABH991_006930 [Bradyrhizobium ottawaense]|uniref:Uncharacterized protein n=1 Tax=Bradyrhizobium ottawaense TaxID=931866 RepID=A0ABV4FYR3_9BRAD